MANRYGTQFPKTIGGEHWFISGSFQFNNVTTPVAANNVGRGWSVARTNVGVHVVTFDDTWPVMPAVNVTLQLAAADDKFLLVRAVNLVARTIEIVTWDISAAALNDIASAVGNRANFLVDFRNTIVP